MTDDAQTPVAQPLTNADLVAALLTRMAEPGFEEEDVLHILGKAAAMPPDPEGFEVAATALRAYVGYDAGTIILDWVTSSNLPALVDDVANVQMDDDARVRLLGLLTRARGVYGIDITKLLQMWQERPSDWRRVSRFMYWDAVALKWLVRIELELYDGSVAAWEGPPSTHVNLARFLLATMNILEDVNGLQGSPFESLAEEYATFQRLYMQPAEATEPEAVAPAAPAPA